MKTRILRNLICIVALFFSTAIINPLNAQNALGTLENTKQYSSMDVIYMDKDLSVFANLLTLSGLATSLAFTNNDHTVFVPTNDAFADMSIEKFAELTSPDNRVMLVDFVDRHFVSSKMHSYDIKDADVLSLDNNKKIKIYSEGSTFTVGGASVVTADIDTENGVIHVLDGAVNVSSTW